MAIFGNNNASAQSYEKMWKQVDALVEADKPKSVITEAEKIYAKAKKEDIFAQMLKAKMLITEKQCDLDPELFLPDEYEKLLSSIESDKSLPADTRAGRLALLHCMLASAYIEMQDSYVHDFDEETREQFPTKAKEHYEAALADMPALARIDNKDYTPLITQQDDSRLYNHDLLSVLLSHILGSWRSQFSEEEKVTLYDQAINVYETNGNRNAATLLRLKALQLRHDSDLKSIRLDNDSYRQQLESLHAQTQDIETGADVDVALITTYDDKEQIVTFAREAIEHWKDSKRVNTFRNILVRQMAPNIKIASGPNVFANQSFPVMINYTNATHATLTIREYNGLDKNNRLSEKGVALDTRRYTVQLDETNQNRKVHNLPFASTTTDNISLPAGRYVLVAETDSAKSTIELSITSICLVTHPAPQTKSTIVTVLDNETGRPVAGATVMCFTGWNVKYGQSPNSRFTTNANGEVSVPCKKHETLRAIAVRDASKYGTPSEDITSTVSLNYYNDRNFSKEGRINVSIFSDRSIYRPGQVIHNSIVAYKQNGDEVSVATNKKFLFTLHNPDYEVLLTDSVTTHEMGTASIEFTIPNDCKLGSYTIEVDSAQNGICASHCIEVAEYKRPTFDVHFDREKNSEKYTLGDNIPVVGQVMTFSDVPVQGADVNYTISWSEHRLYGWWRNNSQNLLSDETTTDDSGEFTINFPSTLPEVVYSDSIAFTVKVEVTDMNGEMQRGEFTFNVKNPDYLKEKAQKNEGPHDELNSSTDEISESQDAVITFKAQEKDALVYYYIYSNDRIERQGTKVLNGDELRLTVKYQKSWGDGVNVLLFYVRNGHYCHQSKSLSYVRPDKHLNLSWKTFRDRLQPGQQEEWVLTVRDQNNRLVSGAELAAVMYDASLDNFRSHEWTFNLDFVRNIIRRSISFSYLNSAFSLYLSPKYDTYPTSKRVFDYLLEFEHQRWYRGAGFGEVSMLAASAPRMNKVMLMDKASADVAEEASINGPAVESAEYGASEENAGNATQTEPTIKTLRDNLSELAFFYPHLTSDQKGEAHIAFTLPDCLTEWKFMAFAHTKSLDYAIITARATAKKDFMVQPNMPRFLREGDKAVISSKVINMCEKSVKGTATLRILNAQSEEIIYTTTTDFSTLPNQQSAVSFPVPSSIAAGDYICDITATDGTSSDGERNHLPVLSTRVKVVENVPFYLDGPSAKSVDLSSIFNGDSPSATDRQISIGYTDNPAIPVFQSLRALQNPKHDNAPCFAASLYSNLVMLDMSTMLSDYLEEFDAEIAKQTADKALSKLQSLQLSDGSWSWFEGMQGSYYITLSVAESLTRLQSYFVHHGKELPSAEIGKMLRKALKYLDRKELADFNYRKAHKLALVPYNDDLRYLYIATSPDKTLLKTYLDAFVKEFRNLTIFGRSQGVCILQKYNRKTEAKKFLDSVKEYTMYKDGFGRYFATDLAYYSWMDYRIPTQLAAMRALQTENERGFLLDMQLWLLRQKQTQTWDNPLNALDIADFLLTNDKDNSLRKPEAPALVLDGKPVQCDSIYSVENVHSLNVTKTSPSVSWGHVRSTFREEVGNLQTYTSGELTISRKVIREGNKVTVRHILHADRDMDFVQVTSQHAASLEPLNVHSGYQWLGGRGCYLEMHDSYATLFFDKFTRGTTTIDLEYYIAREGDYNPGFASIECTYAPEFGAHTSGRDIEIGK